MAGAPQPLSNRRVFRFETGGIAAEGQAIEIGQDMDSNRLEVAITTMRHTIETEVLAYMRQWMDEFYKVQVSCRLHLGLLDGVASSLVRCSNCRNTTSSFDPVNANNGCNCRSSPRSKR